jgi:hypothetical protein
MRGLALTDVISNPWAMRLDFLGRMQYQRQPGENARFIGSPAIQICRFGVDRTDSAMLISAPAASSFANLVVILDLGIALTFHNHCSPILGTASNIGREKKAKMSTMFLRTVKQLITIDGITGPTRRKRLNVRRGASNGLPTRSVE